MKKLFFLFLMIAAGAGLNAQKLDKAKDLLSKKKIAEAKTEIDNVLAVEKNQAVSDAWYTKSKIYIAVSNDPALKATVPDARNTAFDALKKYLELEGKEKDEKKRNLQLTLEGSQPLVEIYSGYSKDGASFYNAGNYNDALSNFKNCLEVFDLMSAKGLTPLKLDTTTTLYAGIAAEKANKRDEAAVYYSRIGDAKAKGEGFVEIYKWLADHYKQKNDVATATKYSAIGKELYPSDPFWTSFDLELLREKGTKEELFKKYDEVVKENPDNHLFLFNYGVELYQAAYDQDSSKRPANSKELITKAKEVLEKCVAIKNDYPNAHMVLGQISYNEGVDFNTQNKAIRPPANGKLTPDQMKKKEELRTNVIKKFDEAAPHFAKVDELLNSQAKLKMDEKEILKNALDLLITINEEKIHQLEQKKNPANDAEIKALQEKNKQYTDKFNNVDRKH